MNLLKYVKYNYVVLPIHETWEAKISICFFLNVTILNLINNNESVEAGQLVFNSL